MQDNEYALMYAAEEKLWWFRALRLFLNRFLPKSPVAPSKPRALDIGCGTGGLLLHLTEVGYEVFGLDYTAIALRYTAQRGIRNLVRGSANDLPFGEAFDLVTCVDILEVSSVDPDRLVETALASLRPGGYGVFVMAAHQWLLSEHDRAVDSVRRYQLGQMKNLFERHDVRVHRASYLFLSVFPLVVVRKLLNRQKTRPAREPVRSDVGVQSALINGPLYFVCWLESQLLRVLNMPMGSSALVLVQKNG